MKISSLLLGVLAAVALGVSGASAQTSSPAPDTAGIIGDTLSPRLTSVDFTTGSLAGSQVTMDGQGILDLAVDRANRRVYALTSTALKIYDLDPSVSPPSLSYRANEDIAVVGTRLALSLDARTAYIGGTGRITAINLFPESVFAGGRSEMISAYANRRGFLFPDKNPPLQDRPVAAMGVHPAGDRLFVVIDMNAADKKLAINNDLLRSDLGSSAGADHFVLPADYGYITQLDITGDVQTVGSAAERRTDASALAPVVNLKDLLPHGKVAIGIKNLAFSPDGNCLFLTAVGAQTPRATAFGIMPTSDESTGGIVVLDVRPAPKRPKVQPWTNYLGFIPTTERDEQTAQLRQQVQQQGWKIVHPEVQWARGQALTAAGAASIGGSNAFTALTTLTAFTVASEVLATLEQSYRDYGYMEAYAKLYPRDMVGASSVAISHRGDFGVVTLQDTNNLGLLAVSSSATLVGYTPAVPGWPAVPATDTTPEIPAIAPTEADLPDFFIKLGTGKTINGFDPQVGNAVGQPGYQASPSAYSWAYPQQVAFTSDDSRLYLGMAGGTPKADLTNRFGGFDATILRTERDRPDSVFKGDNPPPGYALFGGAGGLAFKSPRLVATLHSFDFDGDLISDQTEAFNRWNSLRDIPGDTDGFKKSALFSTVVGELTDPSSQLRAAPFPDDAMDKGLYLPGSGIGYRMDFQGLAPLTDNAGSRRAIAGIEHLGRQWHHAYLAGQVTRPYFVVGAISTPGGGPLTNGLGEPLQYGTRNGFQVTFPYMSTDAGDAAHDFVRSNVPAHPRDNSIQTSEGFDRAHMAKLLQLLLADTAVTKIEIDPAVASTVTEVNFADPRFVRHGSLTRTNSRRDLDSAMTVSFSPLTLKVEVAPPSGTPPSPQAPAPAPGRVQYTVTLPDHLDPLTMILRLPLPAAGVQGAYRVWRKDGTLLEFNKDYLVKDLVDADGRLSLWIDLMGSVGEDLGVEVFSPEPDNVYSLREGLPHVQWTQENNPLRRLAIRDAQQQKPVDDTQRTKVIAETVGFEDGVTYEILKWEPSPHATPSKSPHLPTLDPMTGEIIAGEDEGMLYVKARANSRPALEARPLAIEIGGCSSCSSGTCAVGGKTSHELSSVHFQVSDGNDGALFVHRESAGPGLRSVASLEYPYHDKDTHLILDAAGSIRQVLTRDVLMDVTSVADGYTVTTYARTAAPTYQPTVGLYALTNLGAPVSVLAVRRDPVAGDNGVVLNKQDGGASETYTFRYAPAAHEWTMLELHDPSSDTALRQQSIAYTTETVAGETRYVTTRTTRAADGTVVSKESEVFADLPAGRRIVSQIVDPDGARRTTSYSYNSRGLVASMTFPDGRWIRHEYDSAGRETKRIEPWLNALATAEESACRVTTFDYAPLGSGDTYSPDTPRTTVVTLLGTEIARSYHQQLSNLQRSIVATTPGAAWDDPANLVTTTHSVTAGYFAGRPTSVEFPDGTMAFYEYRQENGGEVSVTKMGAPNALRTAIVDGTATTVVTNRQRHEIARTVVDLASGITIGRQTATDLDAAGRPLEWTYLDGGKSTTVYDCCGVESQTDRSGLTTSYSYDEFHRVKSERRQGLSMSYTYDAANRVRQTTRWGTDGSPLVVSRTEYLDLTGESTDAYDALGRKTSVRTVYNSDGTTTRTTTLPGGFTQWQISARDGSPLEVGGTAAAPVKYEYRVATLGAIPCVVTRTIARVLEPSGAYRDTEWTETWTDLAGRTLRTYAADGAFAENRYNAKGQLVRTIDPDGVSTLFAYDARGERTLTVVDLNRDGVIDYAGTDRLTRTTTAYANKTWQTQTIPVARTTTEIWPETGADTTLVVAVQEQSVDGRRTWSQQFDAVAYAETVYPAVRDGSWTETAKAPDQTSSVSTYRLGRLETKTAQDNTGTQISQIAYAYDPHGRAASVTDARLGATTYTYYDDDQVETVTVPHPVTNGQFLVTKNFYDARGLLERRQLPDQSETFYAYTAQGQLDRVHGSQTYPLDYDYDAQGRMTAMTTWQDYAGDTGQAVTGWRFDPQRGRLEAKRYADGHEVGYTYTAAGRLDTRTWARGVVTHYGYTADGRLANVGYSDPTPGAAYTYHRHGQVQEVRDGVLADSVISDANLRYRHAYSYDAALRPLTETIATTGSHDLTRRYEGTATGEVPGRPRGFTLTATGATAALHTTDYRYDPAGRLQQVVAPAGTFAYTYVANSDLVDTVTGPVATARNVYQPKGQAVATRTNTVGQTVISRFGYTTNALGQRTAASATGAAFVQATHFVYRYNEKGEVIAGERLLGDDPASPGAAVWPESFAYGFDDIGNRRQATRGDPAAPLARQDYVASPLNLYTSLTASGSAPASYDFLPAAPVHDLDGNLTDDARWHYTWDAENRLVAMETQPAAVLAGRPHQRLDFAYDYRSRRVAKKVSTYAAGQWTVASDQRFLYDDWNLIADLTLDPQTSTHNLACTYTWGLDLSGSIQGAGGVGGLLAVTRGESNDAASYFPTYDANGNISEYLNQAGSIVAHREYGPFGEVIRTTGTEETAPFGFSTKYTDSETGLLYYGFRYYNPAAGRWLSRDPLEESGGANLYGLVGNNGINSFDVLGLYQIDIHFYATYMVAKANGRSEADAYKLAYYAQYPDQDHSFDAIPAAVRNILRNITGREKSQYDFDLEEVLHSLHGGSPDQVKAWQKCLAEMIRNEPDGWQKGFMIHAFGDSYSHVRGINGDGTAYKAPEGHLEDGTDPDIPHLRPGVLSNYLTSLNASLGGGADVTAIAAQLTRVPVPQITRRRTHREGGDIYESESVARYRQAREASGFAMDFDPARGKLDRTQEKIPREDVIRLLERIKEHCGCTIGR